ncbi:MAG: enoyl-CoA hydratase/isomerase family protein [Planctomycetes bacterium]|nr:enoyl-CoA hydratase/isomerase family protein [Planctomycetota bacterium]
MDFQYLLVTEKEGVATVTVNRPDKLNALNAGTVAELAAAFADLKVRATVKAVIVTGAGEKAFVAGADIAELSQESPLSARLTAARGQAIFAGIESLGKPVIAAINGYALGGGLELALACTLRVAADSAKLGLPEVGLGIIPGYGGTQRLARLVGKGRALELILTGERIDAAKAQAMGLVNRIFPQAELPAGAEALARQILANGPIALRLAMEAVNRGSDLTLAEGLNLEANLFGLCATTDDMREGMTAFLEKRKPKFLAQ